jgi:hypothetical protein
VLNNSKYSTIQSGKTNSLFGDYCHILGGTTNIVGHATTQVTHSFIGCGTANKIHPDGAGVSGNSVILSGTSNSVYGTFSNVLNGTSNMIGRSTVGTTPTVSTYSTILSGMNHRIYGNQSAILSGQTNIIGSLTLPANNNLIGCGKVNNVSGSNNSVFGGFNTVTGSDCYVMGNNSNVSGSSNFVFNGHTNALSVATSDGVTFSANRYSLFTHPDRLLGVSLSLGSTSWAAVSDRNKKENIVELDSAEILAKVETLPIYHYNYIGTEPGMIYRGPMAQDWHVLFPSDKDPLTIDTMDLDGITLAAVKGLAAIVREQAAQITQQNQRIDSQDEQIKKLIGLIEAKFK